MTAGLARKVDALDRWLDRRAVHGGLLAVAGMVYLWAYAIDPMNPGAAAPAERTGWWSWFDQYRYLQSAADLAQGRISPEHYHYPLGYPLLGAPFWPLFPGHAFLLPNLALVLVSVAFGWKLARRWFGPAASLALGLGFVVTHASLLRLTWVIPWNTLPVQAAFLAGLWLVLARRDRAALLALAGVAAATYLVRPSDAACFAPLLVYATLRLPSWRERLVGGAAGLLVVAAAVAAVAAVNVAVFADWRTPYERMSVTNIGFLAYPYAYKLYWTLVDGETFFGEYGAALLFRYPWLFAAVPGLVWLVRREGAAGAVVVGTVLLNVGLYVAYNDFLPSGLFRFSLIHYVSWAFVPLVLAAAGAAVHGWRDRCALAGWVAAAALFGLAIGLKLKERPLPLAVAAGEVRLPETRPLWIEFPGVPPEEIRHLRLDGRPVADWAPIQVPYVPGPLRVLLDARAQGGRLELVSGAPPPARGGDFAWSWWPRWRRLWPPRD